MALFSGYASFSPSVPPAIRIEWVAHGGRLATQLSGEAQSAYVFCDGSDDPWWPKLYQKSIAIFHWSWISAVVDAGFRLPIAAYVIDTENDHWIPAYSHQESHTSEEEVEEYTVCVEVPDREATYAPLHPRMAQQAIVRHTHGIPEIDLRKLYTKEAFHAQTLHKSRMTGPQDASLLTHQDADDTLVDAPSVLSSGSKFSGLAAISVSDALHALRHVAIDGATQFIPGTIHLGREFRCGYAA